MKRRCDDENHDNYESYGGRGITYQDGWEDFECFLADMGERPEGTTLDRIDFNDHYYKENCRWASAKEQSNNRSSTRLLTFAYLHLSYAEWDEMLGFPRGCVGNRLRKGWTPERTITTPATKQGCHLRGN